MFVRLPYSASILSYSLVPQSDTVIEPLVIDEVMKTAFGVVLRNFMSNRPHATVASSPGL